MCNKLIKKYKKMESCMDQQSAAEYCCYLGTIQATRSYSATLRLQ